MAEEDDPDWIAAHPPEKILDPKTHFTEGAHKGAWSEYDDRGVPTKNAKKKKLTKKEKDQYEQEFLEHKRKHEGYKRDLDTWEQKKLDAEGALEKTDSIRWAFRQIGTEKNEPMEADELEEFFRLMKFNTLSRSECGFLKKELAKMSDANERITLEGIKSYLKGDMAKDILEYRLSNCEQLEDVHPEDLYSPRSWRKKLEEEDANGGARSVKKVKKKSRTGVDSMVLGGDEEGAVSPRSSTKKKTEGGAASPRGAGKKTRTGGVDSMVLGGDGAASPRGAGRKKSEAGGAASPRVKKSESDLAPVSPRTKGKKKTSVA